MPSTVSGCFQAFRDGFVDLPKETTSTARASRDFLYEQIKGLSSSTILAGGTQSFGSFARRTKMRPLDDIDCLATLKCGNTTETFDSAYTYNLRADSVTAALYPYADGNNVNSTKVMNAVKKALESISQYKQSEIGRNGSAVVLNLKSYDWSFDIVPTCLVGTTHFLIPDGTGKWKRTDPRVDAARTESANIKHNGLFLPATRLMKYWNRRTYKPRLPSYYFETLLTNRAATHATYATIQNAIEDLLYGIRESVKSSCPDPKGHEPNLDRDVSDDTRNKVYAAANDAWHASQKAIKEEIAGRHKEAIGYWKSIFGPDFPAFG